MANATELSDKPQLIAFIGLPRSGKSTLATRLSNELGAPIVCKDSIRLAIHGQRYLAEKEPEVREFAKTMLKALFLRGHQIVIADETHYSKEARESVKSPDWMTYWYPVNTSPEVCKHRAIDTNQADLLPVIDEMVSRYVPLEPGELIYKGYVKHLTVYEPVPFSENTRGETNGTDGAESVS